MAKQKIYKIAEQLGDKIVFRYFTQESLAPVTAELIGMAGATPRNFSVNTVDADTASMNLDAFLKAGGILIGSAEIK